jgi:hypothetical protein
MLQMGQCSNIPFCDSDGCSQAQNDKKQSDLTSEKRCQYRARLADGRVVFISSGKATSSQDNKILRLVISEGLRSGEDSGCGTGPRG